MKFLSRILVTTTHLVEGTHINQYLGVIHHSVVVGSNVFSDISASLTDFFGGFSRSYEKRLQLIIDEALLGIESKAILKGANAIVGLSLDIDEISGGGKSMFMISVCGTAVILDSDSKSNRDSQPRQSRVIAQQNLEYEINKTILRKKLNRNVALTDDDWSKINIYCDVQMLGLLIPRFLADYNSESQSLRKSIYTQMVQFLTSIDSQVASEALYTYILENKSVITQIIKDAHLFSPPHIMKLINDGELKLALDLLGCQKEFYTDTDLSEMKKIQQHLENLPNLGEIKSVKGMLGKERERYICPRGHNNPDNFKYCEVCRLNIKGLYDDQDAILSDFSEKINALSSMLNSN